MKETAWNRPNLRHIWTYRWQRRSAATNIASTDCNLPTQGWSDQSNWIAHGKLSRRYFCPGKVQRGWLGWAPAGAEPAPSPSVNGNANLLARRYSCSVLLWSWKNSHFLVSGLLVFRGRSSRRCLHAWRFPDWAAPCCLSQFMATDCCFLETLWMFSKSLHLSATYNTFQHWGTRQRLRFSSQPTRGSGG